MFQNVKIQGVATGCYHSLAWDNNGSIYSWGDTTEGKLGHGIQRKTVEELQEEDMSQIQIFPKKIESLSEEFVILASCGSKYSCCITNSGDMYAWGKGGYKA